MKGVPFRPQRSARLQVPICQICQFSTVRAGHRRPISQPYAPTSLQHSRDVYPGLRSQRTWRVPLIAPQSISGRFASSTSKTSIPADPEVALQQVQKEFRAIRDADSVPSDETVVQLLQKCQKIVESIVLQEHEHHGSSTNRDEGNATSSLLSLEEKTLSAQRSNASQSTERRVTDSISQLANELLRDEKVFISPGALEYYTKIQTLVKNAEHFPEIFALYANKPVPQANSSPIKYRPQDPKSVNNAVPSELANMALDVAIDQKNLPLVLAIIDNTFCAPAFYRAKVFKKAALPLSGLAAAPAASYAVASWASTLQNTMDPSTATGIAFAATLAYIGFTSSVGIIAITTANDQMERVVWLPGMPLRQRWLREEERAALDKVACAWGFKDPWRRGEEEGEEWEALREFIGIRGMILDKSDLMEGME
ncbi:hypothetical protein VTN02DRAFT_1919 [Thermoascus thermophilus]